MACQKEKKIKKTNKLNTLRKHKNQIVTNIDHTEYTINIYYISEEIGKRDLKPNKRNNC